MSGERNSGQLIAAQGVFLAGRRRAIDWPYLVQRRAAVLKHSTLPPYLLLPEIRALIDSAKHANHHLLLSTLWHTGARVSEVLALTPGSFDLDPRGSYVSLTTLKQRGRPKAGGLARRPARMIPITDPLFVRELETYFATERVPRGERIFPITRQAVDLRVRAAARAVQDAGTKLSMPVSAHTFRHSFAVNAVLHGIPLTVLQGWLGHKHLQTSAIYTQVLAAETGHLMQLIEF